MVNYLQKKKSQIPIFLMTFVKMAIICGPKYKGAVLSFLVFTGVGS